MFLSGNIYFQPYEQMPIKETFNPMTDQTVNHETLIVFSDLNRNQLVLFIHWLLYL